MPDLLIVFIELRSWDRGAKYLGDRRKHASKLLVALQLEVAHHFIERCAGRRSRGLEPPATFGATKTPKPRLLNPYQLSAHGLMLQRPTFV